MTRYTFALPHWSLYGNTFIWEEYAVKKILCAYGSFVNYRPLWYFALNFSCWLEIWNTFLLPVTIFSNSLKFNLENIFSNCLVSCTPNRFWSSVNICDFNLTEIFHTFQIGFKMKCTRNGHIPTALIILLIVYMPSLSTITLTFETFTLLVTTKGRPDIAASLMHYLPVRNNFLHLRTVFTLSDPKTSPDVVNHFLFMDKNLLHDKI